MPLESVRISRSVIIAAVGRHRAIRLFVLKVQGIRALRARPVTGVEAMVSEIGESLEGANPDGTVRVHGDLVGRISTGAAVPVQRRR